MCLVISLIILHNGLGQTSFLFGNHSQDMHPLNHNCLYISLRVIDPNLEYALYSCETASYTICNMYQQHIIFAYSEDKVFLCSPLYPNDKTILPIIFIFLMESKWPI